MKRFLCQTHVWYLSRCKQRPVFPGTTQTCTVCRWEARPWTLGDYAIELENIACSVRLAVEHPSFDPIGLSYGPPIEDFILNWILGMHPAYSKPLMEKLNESYQAKVNRPDKE